MNEHVFNFMRRALLETFRENTGLNEHLAAAVQKVQKYPNTYFEEDFSLIRQGIDHIQKYGERSDNNPHAIILENGFSEELENLDFLVSRIRYNKYFNQYSHDVAQETVKSLSQDHASIDWMRNWWLTRDDEDSVIHFAQRFLSHQNEAARTVAEKLHQEITFTQPAVRQEKIRPVIHPHTGDMQILMSYITVDADPSLPASIVVNMDQNACYTDPCNLAYALGHEGFHSIQKDVGATYALHPENLDIFLQAGKLWHFMTITGSGVPMTIPRLYEKQFQEVSANDHGLMIRKGLLDILSATPNRTISFEPV